MLLLAAVGLAYLLEWPTARLQRLGCSRSWATSIVLVLIVAPVAWQQGINLTRYLPNMLKKLYLFSAGLPKRFLVLMDAGIIDLIVENLRGRLSGGDSLVRYSLASLVGLMTLMIYLVLVPLMVFFLLKDKEQMLNAVSRLLPRNRGLAGDESADHQLYPR